MALYYATIPLFLKQHGNGWPSITAATGGWGGEVSVKKDRKEWGGRGGEGVQAGVHLNLM